MIMDYCNFELLGSSNPPASGSQVPGIIDARHHTWPIFSFLVFVEMESHPVDQDGLDPLTL